MKKIAFIGIGLMGFPMAKNLLKNGYNVSVFDKKIYKAKRLSKYGALISKSLKDVIKNTQVIIQHIFSISNPKLKLSKSEVLTARHRFRCS